MPAGGEGNAIVVERAEKALVVRAKDADTEAVGFAAALPPEPSRTTVVVDASAADALHALDERLLDELLKRLYADSPPGWEMRLVAARTGRPDPSGAPPLAARLADRLGVGVVAPDGELIALRGGELFSAGPGAGWLGFRRGAHPEWTGPRYPAPAWQAALPREFRTAKPRAFARFRDRRGGGRPVTVTAIPAGLWVRGAGTAPLPLVDLGFGVPVETARPIVLVGAPGERGPGVAELTAFFRSLPPDVRENAVLVPYGQAPETCATLAQGLADRLDTTVRAYHALPHYATDGTRRFAIFNESGTPERLTQTPESVYPPAGAAQPRPWAAPYAGPEVHRPGVMDVVPGRRRKDREEEDVDPVVFESSIDTPTQPIAALEESAYTEPPEESWAAVVTVDAQGTMRPVTRSAHGRGTDPWTILPSPRPEPRNAAPEPVGPVAGEPEPVVAAGERELAAVAEREPVAGEWVPVAVAAAERQPVVAGEQELTAAEREPVAAEWVPVAVAAGEREPVAVADREPAAVSEPESAAARTSAPAPSAVPAASGVPGASAAPAASVAPASSAAPVALRTMVSTALPQTRAAARSVPMREEPVGRTTDRLSPRVPGETPGTGARPEPGNRSAPVVRGEEGYPGRPENGSTAGPRPAAATDVPVAGSWNPPARTSAAGSGEDGDWSSEETSWAPPAAETGAPGWEAPADAGTPPASSVISEPGGRMGTEEPARTRHAPSTGAAPDRAATASTGSWDQPAENSGTPTQDRANAGSWDATAVDPGGAATDGREASPSTGSWDAPAAEFDGAAVASRDTPGGAGSWAAPAAESGGAAIANRDTPAGEGPWNPSAVDAGGAPQGRASAGTWDAPAAAGTVRGRASSGSWDAAARGKEVLATAGPPFADPVSAGREIPQGEWPAVESGAGVARNTPEAGGPSWPPPGTLPPTDTRMAAPAAPSWDAPASREPGPAAGGSSDANPSASGPRSAWPPSAAPSPEIPRSASELRPPQAAPPGNAPMPQDRRRPAATGGPAHAGTAPSWETPVAREHGGPVAAGGYRGPSPAEVAGGWPPAAPNGNPSAAPNGNPWAVPSGKQSTAPNGHPAGAPNGQPSAVPNGHPSAVANAQPVGAPFGEGAVGPQEVAFVEPAPGVPLGTRPGAPLGASLGARQPGAYVPDYDRLWLADRTSTPDERQAFRSALGWRYDAATRAVARLLAEHPGLRSAELDEALMTEFAAVRVFAGRDEAAMVESIRAGGHGDDRALAVCAAGGLRRLPALQGVVVRGGPADPGAADAYRPGQDLVEAAPIIALDDLDASVPGGVELLIWSATARRLDGFAEGRPVQEVIFLPATVFRVIAVDPPGDAPVRRVLLTEVPPGKAGPGQEKWAARVTARLEEAAANRTAPPAEPDDRFAPLPGDPARSMP